MKLLRLGRYFVGRQRRLADDFFLDLGTGWSTLCLTLGLQLLALAFGLFPLPLRK
jgi:hypothetical protein